jgi:hypothetical protein
LGVDAAAASPPAATDAAQQVVARLQDAYRRGDAATLAALFTENARTNEGVGRALIRRVYSDFFRRTTANRLSVSGLTWRKGPDGRLVGKGRVTVSNRYKDEGPWRHATGRIELGLSAGSRGYQITQLFYQLD